MEAAMTVVVFVLFCAAIFFGVRGLYRFTRR